MYFTFRVILSKLKEKYKIFNGHFQNLRKVNIKKMPLFGKKDSGKKAKAKDNKELNKQVSIEEKYNLHGLLGTYVINIKICVV